MVPVSPNNKSKIIGSAILFGVIIMNFIIIVTCFRDLVKEDKLTLAYLFMTITTALVLLVLVWKKYVSGKNLLVSIPLTLVVLFFVLLFACRWCDTPEGLVLAAPKWLGGFYQCVSAPSLKRPSKLIEIVSKAFSWDSFFGQSVYIRTLFYWPGLIIWVASILILSLFSANSLRIRLV